MKFNGKSGSGVKGVPTAEPLWGMCSIGPFQQELCLYSLRIKVSTSSVKVLMKHEQIET